MKKEKIPIEKLCRFHRSSSKNSVKSVEVEQKPTILWLDPSEENKKNDEFRRIVKLFNQTVTEIIFVSKISDCEIRLDSNEEENFILILPGSIGENFVPKIHENDRIISISIFCHDRNKHSIWSKNWKKIQGVFTETASICEMLRWKIHRYQNDSLPYSVFSTENAPLGDTVDRLDQSFMYTQILRDIILRTKFKKENIKDFILFCREKYFEDEKELKNIQKFETEYEPNKAIWWYTNECFLYPMLNRALRTMEVEVVIKLGFFIRHLHEQIDELYQKQYIKPKNYESFDVYRGLTITKLEFDILKSQIGYLLAFNSFLSTSKKQTVGLVYASRNLKNEDSVGILLEMNIKPNESQTPFALINGYSVFKASEQEILFSMNTVFRIVSIKPIEHETNRLWNIQLKLTDEKDEQLKILTDYLKKETEGADGWFCIAQFLIKFGRYQESEKLYRALQPNVEKEKLSYIFHQLGVIRNLMADYQSAISFFEESLRIDQKKYSSNDPNLAVTYDNLGRAYQHICQYDIALVCHERALSIYRANNINDSTDLATFLTNIGLVHLSLGNYSQALLSHRAALEINSKILPGCHPNIAACFSNIGLVHLRKSEIPLALSFFKMALSINKNSLPASHPDLARSYQNLAKSFAANEEYEEALKNHRIAKDIFLKNFPENHPDIANCYFLEAIIYSELKDYNKALDFHETALKIREKSLPSNHPLVIESKDAIGEIFILLSDYNQAQKQFESTLAIQKQTLRSNSSKLAAVYFNLVRVFLLSSKFDEAEHFCCETLAIATQTLGENDPILINYKQTLEIIKKSR